MSLLQAAKDEFDSFISDETLFAVPISFTHSDGSSTANITCVHTKHKTQYSDEGETVNIEIASVAISERLLNAESYSVRDSDGYIDFENHKVHVADSTGVTKDYHVDQWFPDDMLGVLVLILKHYIV